MKIKYIIFFLATSWLAYDVTDNSYTENSIKAGLREPSSEEKKETRNGYSHLRCPTEAEFQKWSTELNIDPIDGPSLDAGCKTRSIRSQLAQVLALSKEIKINFPKKWAPSVQAEIKNSYNYIRSKTDKLVIDLSQTNSVARNLVAQRKIELGGMFFKEDALEALSVLVHEARHSDERDQGHTTCRTGDIPLTQGGCDPFFSNKAEDAGAYAYGTLFQLAIAQYSGNLDNAERELMISGALVMLSTRFNTFKSTLAKHSDIVTVLLENGSIAWVHPYSGELIPLNIELPDFQEKIKKIEFSPRTSSLMMFTESNRLFLWGPNHKVIRLSPEATSPDDRFLHASRQYVPFVNDYSYYTILKTSGKLEYIKYNPELNKLEVLDYPLLASAADPNPVVPNLASFVLANGMRSYFLDKKGLISRAHNFANEPNFIIDSIQSSTGGYKNATGGIFYDTLVLTDSDGKLVRVKIDYPEGTDDEKQVKENFEFQAPQRAKKYAQGLSFHAVLDEDGSILLEHYRAEKARVLLKYDQKIVDFVITRVTSAESEILKQKSQINAKCHVRSEIHSVGYGSTLALADDGTLLAVNSNSTCTKLLSGKHWNSGELVGVDSNNPVVQPFADLFLKLSGQTEKMNLLPYTRSGN